MKISAGLRMYVQPCLSVIVCVAVAVVGLRGLANVARTVDDMSITSTALRNHMEGDMMHDALRADVLAAMLAATDEDKQQVLSDIKDHSENFRASLKANTQLNLNAEVKAAIMETETKLGEYIKGAEEMVALALKNREDAEGRLPAFLTLFGELEELESAASEKVEASAKAAVETEERTVAGTQTTMFVGGGLAVLVLVVCAVLTIRSIVVPLRSCLSVLTSCAGGDLTKRTSWKGGDEFGVLAASTNTLAENFGKIIRAVQGSATEVASAATQIASSANEMSAAVDDVAKQTTRTSESASESGRIAREGGEVVRHTVDGMQQINNAVSASAASVTKLGNRGREIGEIIGVINDIADQTNLLALNAAIEAARAGEHGRGFAVVADEVRKLAERTTRATEEVGQSIQAIQKETEEAVRRMHAGTEQVKVGVQLATQAGESLDQIVTGATDVAGMVQSISAAAEEAGAGARQSADAAVQLSQKAEQLQQMVSQFTIDQK